MKRFGLTAVATVAMAMLAAAAPGIDFQKQIDAAAAKGGGRVVVPAGLHDIKSLRLRSHVELHLEKGAVLRGSLRREDYFDFPVDICPVRPESSGLVLIYAWDAEDIAITGEGTVEGRGPEFFPGRDETLTAPKHWPKPALPRPREVQFVRCRNVRLQGATFKDSPGWTMLIRLCENVYVDGIRVESDQRIMNSDGIDFDSCRHVRVGNSTFKTGDDCLILRAMRGSPEGSALCEDVVVSNCVLDSTCQTIRMGCPSDDTIRNALFKDIKGRGHNGIFFDYPTRYLRPTDEGYMNISGIVFDGYSGSFTGSALQIVVQDGVKIRGVRNIEFRNFDVTTTRPVRFIHNVDSPFENVRFSNVTVNGARQPDGPVTAECRPSRPLVREHKSWETKKDRSKFHLFVLAGQSNMSGRGELTATNRVPHDRVLVMSRDGTWRDAVEPFHWEKPKACGAGLAASFARAYADAHPGVTVGLVPVAYGGSPIARWQPGKVHYTNAVHYAKLALRDGVIKGVLWHQGESDAFRTATLEAYLPKFTNAITQLRRELGAERVPFLAGELGPYLKDWHEARRPNMYWQEMNAEIAKGVKLLPCAAVVPSEGLYDVKRDKIHFATPALRAFGLRYWDVYRKMQTEK